MRAPDALAGNLSRESIFVAGTFPMWIVLSVHTKGEAHAR